MKNKYLLITLLLAATICIAPSCKKNNAAPDQLSLLPPATQTGANTFGCLVNGQAFLPQGGSYLAAVQCNYIYTNGGYYLTVSGLNDGNKDYAIRITLNTNLLAISEGQTLILRDLNVPGQASGLYAFNNPQVTTYATTSMINGQMHISKMDTLNQIVSGTFFFSAVNPLKSDTMHITDGRFDMKYTR